MARAGTTVCRKSNLRKHKKDHCLSSFLIFLLVGGAETPRTDKKINKMSLDYKISLYSVDFDNKCDNTIYFATRAQQTGYFNSLTNKTPKVDVNFNFGTLLTASATFDAPYKDARALSYNYAIIEKQNEKSLFYFIKKATYKTANRVALDLELDVLQTYFIDLNFEKCLIKRAHLKRFVNVGENKVEFNTTGAGGSAFLQRDDFQNAPQYVERLERLSVAADAEDDSPLNRFLNKYILCWCYIYLKKGKYKCKSLEGIDVEREIEFNQTILPKSNPVYKVNKIVDFPYTVIALPIFRRYDTESEPQILIQNGVSNFYRQFKITDLSKFFELNPNLEANILSIKFSPCPPFFKKMVGLPNYDGIDFLNSSYDYGYNVANNKLVINGDNLNLDIFITHVTTLATQLICDGILAIKKQNLIGHDLIKTLTNKKIKFNWERDRFEVMRRGNGAEYNPKCYLSDFRNYEISNGINSLEIEPLKIFSTFREGNPNGGNFKFLESFSPDVTRQYFGYNPDDFIALADAYYPANYYDAQFWAGNGVVSLIDATTPFSVGQLESFLAQNKNFFLQKNAQIGKKALLGYGGSLAGGLLSAAAGSLAGVVGAVGGAIGTTADIAFTNAQANFSIDNMRNAPPDIEHLSGNIGELLGVFGANLWLKTTVALPADIEKQNDYNKLYGFPYNRIANLKDFVNLRVSYNFVQAEVHDVNTSEGISNEIREKIRTVFRKGVRFWNQSGGPLFDEDNQNYEVGL